MNEKPYTLTFNLKDRGSYATFAEAFKELHRLVGTEPTSLMLIETACWIKHADAPLPQMFYSCVERAHEEGLLKDGQPTWK